MKKFGIDISVWQKGINLSKAKNEGVKFAILRGMYGNEKDTEFETYYKNAKAIGLDVGVYQWGRAANVAQAREEAQILIDNCLKGKQFEYPIYYDVEDSILINLSVNDLTEVIKAWAETLENAGYFVGVYINQSSFNNEVRGQELSKLYTQWRAYWTTEKNKPDAQLWQFGGETNLIRSNKIAGYVCDQNYAYEDFPTIIKNAGLNGFSKEIDNVASPITILDIQKEYNSKFGSILGTIAEDNSAGPDTRKHIIMALQYEMNKQYGSSLVIDGSFGSATKKAFYDLKQGVTGNITWLCQAMLYIKGYNPNGLDGSYGPGMKACVTQYQKDKGLKVDGILGPNTAYSLFN